MKKSDMNLIPVAQATTPKDGLVHCHVDCWWIVIDECLVFYKPPRWRGAGTPQCNANEEITRKIGAKLYPGAEVRKIPVVYIEAEPAEFEY